MAEFYNKVNASYIDVIKRPALEYKFKIELLDHNERGLGEIIRDIDSSNIGQININRQQGMRRSCSFTIIDVDKKYLPNINNHFWYNRKFKLYTGVVDGDDTYWFSQGVFITQTASAVHYTVSISAVDKFGFLDGTLNVHTLNESYKIEVGVSVGECTREILMLEIGNGLPIDPIEPIIDPDFENRKLINEIILDAGQHLGEALTQIATTLGADLFYDRYGRLNLTRVFNDDLPSWYIHKGEIWHFTDVHPNYIDPSLNYEFDGINCVTVAIDNGNDTSKELISYTAINDNPRSPVAVSEIGYRCNENDPIIYIPAGDIESEDTPLEKCRQHSEYVLLQNTCMSTPLSFKCPLIPHLDVDETISITDSYYNWNVKSFLIQSISMPFGIGEMDISAINLQWLSIDTDSASITLQKGTPTMPVYTISYNIGEGEGKTPSSYSDIAGTSIKLADDSNFEHYTKEFVNWVDDMTGQEWGEYYWHNYSYTIPSQNVLMTANYKEYAGDGILEMKITIDNVNFTAYPVFDDNKQMIWWGDDSFSKLNAYEVSHNYDTIGEYSIHIQELEGTIGTFNELNFQKYLENYTVSEIYLPDTITSISELMNESIGLSFETLETLKLPSNLQNIVNSSRGFCSGLSILKQIIFPTSECTINGTAFNESFTSDAEIVIPHNITFNSTGNIFTVCNMKSVKFYGVLTNTATIFASCPNLTQAILDGIGSLASGTLHNCPNLEKVIIGSNMCLNNNSGFGSDLPKLSSLTIESGATTLLNSGFLYYTNTTNQAMTSLDLSETSIIEIQSGCISGLTALEEIRFPTGLTVLNQEICYGDLPSLKRVYFGNEITSIDTTCFSGLTDLTVYGYAGTYIETWAEGRGFTFVDIEQGGD